MNGFTAADMSTAAADGFRDGLAAQPAAAQEAVGVDSYDDAMDQMWKLAGGNDSPVYKLFLGFRDSFAAPVAAAPVEPDLDAYDPASGELAAQWLYRNGLEKLAAVLRGQLDIRGARIRELSASTPAAPVGVTTTDARSLAFEVEKALGWRENERDEELDSLLISAMNILQCTPAAPGIDLRAVVLEYISARDAHELATRPLNSHAPVRQLPHGSPITRRWADAREALRLAMSDAIPKGGSDASAWRGPGELPAVGRGDMGWFCVAVRRANGMTYNFPASYLNAMLLSDQDGGHDEPKAGNRYSYGAADEDDGSFPATGWHEAKEHSEYDSIYMPLLADGDELIAWRAVEDFTLQATSAEVGVVCTTCQDSGEVIGQEGSGPDVYDVTVICPHCSQQPTSHGAGVSDD